MITPNDSYLGSEQSIQESNIEYESVDAGFVLVSQYRASNKVTLSRSFNLD